MPCQDVVVFLPGITGSVLKKDGREVWGTDACAIWRAVVSGGGSFHELELPNGASASDTFDDGIQTGGLVKDLHLIPGLWKIDGYSSACDKIVSDHKLVRGKNFIEFAYDWRFDNRRSAKQLAERVHKVLRDWRVTSGNDNAKLIFVAHSMGGLISRYFIECMEGWKDTLALVTYGTPYRGAACALGYLSNGFSKGIGPLKTDLSDVIRSMDSVYQLLPTYKCLDTGNGALSYIKDAADISGIDRGRATKAAEFHDEIARAHNKNLNDADYMAAQYRIYPVVGTFQPTWLSALTKGNKIELLRTLGGIDSGGDGTVPRGAAVPLEQEDASQGMFTEHVHAALQNVKAVQDQLRGILTGIRTDDQFRAAEPEHVVIPGMLLDDVYVAGQENYLVVQPTVIDRRAYKNSATGDFLGDTVRNSGEIVDLIADIVELTTGQSQRTMFQRDMSDGLYRAPFRLAEGAYQATVYTDDPEKGVSEPFLVLGGSV